MNPDCLTSCPGTTFIHSLSTTDLQWSASKLMYQKPRCITKLFHSDLSFRPLCLPYAPSLCFDASFLIILLSPKHILPFNAFFLTLTHLFSLGRLRHELFELHVLIVVGNLMPTDSLFSSPPLSSRLHPGGVLNGNTLLWITQQGAPWLIALLTIY